MLNFSDYADAGAVFRFFEEISAIPRGSGNTSAIADYLVDFAKTRELTAVRDACNNVIIKKGAAEGYENADAVILQGHTDMVIATDENIERDVTVDGVDLFVDGDFLKARGSTLGADNGIAVAYMLAILDSQDMPHPPIEAVFTSDEEIGLIGAGALDTSSLGAKTMINLDSDEEGVFTAGCAGGLRMDATLPVSTENTEEYYKISVSGLRGGHSGTEINKGRINAIKLLGEIIPDKAAVGEISGGNADNAIPTYAECKIYPLCDAQEKIDAALIKYRDTEKNISITCEKVNEKAGLLSFEDSRRAVGLIRSAPNGVIAMNREIPDLVETSLNLGLIKSEPKCITLTFALRSSDGKEKEALAQRVSQVAQAHGAKTAKSSEYPGWKYASVSPIREHFVNTYRSLFGKEAEIITIHAGLECGLFADKIPMLDCISLGPTAYDIHTSKEKLSIPSAVRTYRLLCEVLSSLKGDKK